MSEAPRTLLENLSRAVQTRPGALPPEERQAIVRYAADASAGQGETDSAGIRESLRPYVDKVARHAYKVTDEDVTGLTAAGVSEDGIFEATIAAAVGTANVRAESGLAALERARERRAASGEEGRAATHP